MTRIISESDAEVPCQEKTVRFSTSSHPMSNRFGSYFGSIFSMVK